MNLEERLTKIKSTLPPGVKLVAVSKFVQESVIEQAYNYGQRIFAESRPQELKDKMLNLPKDIQWHFIGHLQTNKIKYLIPGVSMIQSVDSEKLLYAINERAINTSSVVDILLEYKISEDPGKLGFTIGDIERVLSSWRKLSGVKFCGLMAMASLTEDKSLINNEFARVRDLFYDLKERYFQDNNNFCEISMGMSDDFLIAVQNGATIVRVGSAIFGERISTN